MTRRLFIFAVLFPSLAACGARESADGILITQRVTSGGAPLTTQVQIQPTRVRTEMAGPDGITAVTIFDAGTGVLYNIDPARKTYTEMTKDDVARLSAQMNVGAAGMRAQLDKLPSAERAKMEAMMKGVEVTRAGTDTVSRWTCDKYELTLAGQKIGERCTVSLTTLGFATADFDVMNQMAAFYSVMGPQSPGQLAAPVADTPGIADFPVRTVVILPPAGAVTTEVIEVSRQPLPDSLFTVPAGFTKRNLPAELGGRGNEAKP